jgi:hypothetical protein
MALILWNDSDGIQATPETYESVTEALAAAALWFRRFKRQGYYATAKMDRIPLEYLHLAVHREHDNHLTTEGWIRLHTPESLSREWDSDMFVEISSEGLGIEIIDPIRLLDEWAEA